MRWILHPSHYPVLARAKKAWCKWSDGHKIPSESCVARSLFLHTYPAILPLHFIWTLREYSARFVAYRSLLATQRAHLCDLTCFLPHTTSRIAFSCSNRGRLLLHIASMFQLVKVEWDIRFISVLPFVFLRWRSSAPVSGASHEITRLDLFGWPPRPFRCRVIYWQEILQVVATLEIQYALNSAYTYIH